MSARRIGDGAPARTYDHGRGDVMELGVLGPLGVQVDGRDIDVGGRRRRVLLARLALAVDRPVSATRLAHDVWNGHPPPAAVQTLQSHVSQLRRLLGGDRIATDSGGYRLVMPPSAIDAVAFEADVRQARTVAPAAAIVHLERALGRWRGPAYVDADGAEWCVGEVARLDELRVSALELLLDARLAAGELDAVVADGEAAVAEHPLRERLWATLMQALHRSGRQADALRAFQRARASLADVGLEPTPELAGLETTLLTSGASPSSVAVATGGRTAPPTGVVTFLFTDVVGSTQLWEAAPAAMEVSLEQHDDVVRTAVERHRGVVFATGGDGFAAAFARVADAVAAAREAQAALAALEWPDGAALRVRMALHTGEAVERDGDYFGPAVNRAARLMGIAHGGQVLCSAASAALLDGSVELVDLGMHRLRGVGAPERVHQLGPGRFPPLRSDGGGTSELPARVNELIGRDEELIALIEATRSHRLVTLTGVGGVGKTRLALAIAATVGGDFTDGCALVELAAVADPQDVQRAVTGVLGAPGVAAHDHSALARYLEHRHLVLILDNCEHVLDAVAGLVEAVLRTARGVHVLATSREPLGVDGEIVRRVRSLDERHAIELFVERARAVADGFSLSESNAPYVSDICQRLDGIPLALELAAARVAAMAPAEIARRLDDRFRVLTGGRRAEERHRTLQTAVGWSYDLLSEDERRVFARLSVFPATFDLDAALAVADTDDPDAIVRLVERSLVVHDESTGRYRLLETLRQFAAEKLVSIGEAGASRARYAAFYARLASTFGPAVVDDRCDTAMTVLFAELDNLRATGDWLAREGSWPELLRFVRDAFTLFTLLMSPDNARWLDALLTGDARDVADRITILGMASQNAGTGGDFGTATCHGEESLALATAHGRRASPHAHMGLSMACHMGRNDAAAALPHADTVFEIAAGDGSAYNAIEALALSFVPLVQLGRAEVDERIDDTLRRAERLGNAHAMSLFLACACQALLMRRGPGDIARARRLLESYGERGLRPYGGLLAAWVLATRAMVVTDDPAAAIVDAVEAARGADRYGAPHGVMVAVDAVVAPCVAIGLVDEACRLNAYVEEHRDLHVNTSAYGYLSDVRRRVLSALDPAVVRAAVAPRNRQELFALLARIEAAANG